MKTFRLLALLAVLAPAVIQAQASGDPHADLALALSSDETFASQTEAMLIAFRDQYAADPDIAALETECPGVLDTMDGVLREITTRDQAELKTEYRTELADFFRAEMPADQAAEAAAFYRSELGQKLVGTVNASRSFGSTVQSALQSEGRVDPDAFAADNARAEKTVADSLRAELFAMSVEYGDREWTKTMSRLRPRLRKFTMAQLNAELTPEEEAEIEQDMTESLTAHIEKCED